MSKSDEELALDLVLDYQGKTFRDVTEPMRWLKGRIVRTFASIRAEERQKFEKLLSELKQRRGKSVLSPVALKLIADAEAKGRKQGMMEASAKVGSLAERPYDHEPEFSCVLAIENYLRQASEKMEG